MMRHGAGVTGVMAPWQRVANRLHAHKGGLPGDARYASRHEATARRRRRHCESPQEQQRELWPTALLYCRAKQKRTGVRCALEHARRAGPIAARAHVGLDVSGLLDFVPGNKVGPWRPRSKCSSNRWRIRPGIQLWLLEVQSRVGWDLVAAIRREQGRRRAPEERARAYAEPARLL
jgi:hypothetical protein